MTTTPNKTARQRLGEAIKQEREARHVPQRTAANSSRRSAPGDKPTDRQREILDYMIEYSDEHGMPPSIREIGDALSIASMNDVTDHLKALKAKGLVRHYPTRARGWVPVRS